MLAPPNSQRILEHLIIRQPSKASSSTSNAAASIEQASATTANNPRCEWSLSSLLGALLFVGPASFRTMPTWLADSPGIRREANISMNKAASKYNSVQSVFENLIRSQGALDHPR